jgi:hypothetical protein
MATQYTAGLTAGQILTAATMNSIGAAWESYTPVIKGGATTVTATLTYAKYFQINKIVFVEVFATVTSAGAANGRITMTLPINPAFGGGNLFTVGNFTVLDTGTAFYTGAAIIDANIVSGLAYGSTDNMGVNTPAMTLANGDRVAMSICYEIA